MNRNKILSYLLQSIATCAILLPLYIVLALLDYNGGFPSFIGFILQPLIGLLLSIITILVCTIIGLAIRVVNRINSWWIRRPFIPITGFIIATTLILLSFLPSVRETISYMDGEYPIQKEVPNETMILAGWFLLAFCILHFYPVAYIKNKRLPPSW